MSLFDGRGRATPDTTIFRGAAFLRPFQKPHLLSPPRSDPEQPPPGAREKSVGMMDIFDEPKRCCCWPGAATMCRVCPWGSPKNTYLKKLGLGPKHTKKKARQHGPNNKNERERERWREKRTLYNSGETTAVLTFLAAGGLQKNLAAGPRARCASGRPAVFVDSPADRTTCTKVQANPGGPAESCMMMVEPLSSGTKANPPHVFRHLLAAAHSTK